MVSLNPDHSKRPVYKLMLTLFTDLITDLRLGLASFSFRLRHISAVHGTDR